MAETHRFCPRCETRIRFRSGLPDRNWIECPRCGKEVPLSRSRSRRSGSRRGERPAAAPTPRRSRARTSPQRKSRPSRDSGGGSAGLWVGVIGGSIGILGLILGLIFFVSADEDPPAGPDAIAESDETGEKVNDSEIDEPVTPIQQLVGKVADDEPAAPTIPAANPSPTLGPGPDGVIPAPPAPGHVNETGKESDKVRYGLKTGREFAYRTTIEANMGEEIHRTRGLTKYEVLGQDPELSRRIGPEVGEQQGSGTGFVVHPQGYLMTCAHVVEDATKIEVDLAGKTYAARVIEINSQRDLALLRISARGLPVLPMGNSGEVQLAQHVRVVGYPLSDVLGTSVKITQGSVAGFIDRENGRMIQVDASMNPGNSGGPLVNDRGEAVGVASAGFFGSDISEVGLAVPAQDVIALMRKNGVSAKGLQSGTKLEGPELARQVTPSVAYIRVTVSSAPKESFVLKQFTTFSTSKRRSDGRPTPGRLPSSSKTDSGKILLNEYGEILQSEKNEAILPYGLGPMSHLAIEPFSADGETTWGTQRMTTITQIKREKSRFNPYSRFGRRSRFRRPRGLPRSRSPYDRGGSTEVAKTYLALEICQYELTESTPDTQVIHKIYEFQTIDDVDKPHFQLSGNGTIRFDRRSRLPDQIHYRLQLRIRSDDGVVRVPIDVLCERFTDQELADYNKLLADARKQAQERAQKRAQKNAANPPTNRPATRPSAPGADTASLSQQLATITNPNANFSKKYIALNAIKKTTPDDKNRKTVLDAVEPLLTDSNSSLQNTAIDVFGIWGTEDRAGVLMKMVGGISRSHRWAAMEALGQIGGKKSAETVAKRLTDKTDRLTAARALKKMGSVAEEPALKHINHPEQQVRYQVYQILGEVGGQKSRAALQKKSQSDPNGFNRAAAGIALRKLQKP